MKEEITLTEQRSVSILLPLATDLNLKDKHYVFPDFQRFGIISSLHVLSFFYCVV